MSQARIKGRNMALIFGISFLYAFLIAMSLNFLTIHQWGAISMVARDIAAAKPSYPAFMADYGTTFRTFKHGMLHGFMASLSLALPIIGTNALLERKSWQYTLVNGRFWIVCFMLMGGLICAWA